MGSHDEEQLAIFTTIRYDPKLGLHKDKEAISHQHDHSTCLYMVDYHRERMLLAARKFNWPEAISILSQQEMFEHFLVTKVTEHNKLSSGVLGSLRVRVECTRAGELSTVIGATPPVSLHDLYPKSLSDHGPSPTSALPSIQSSEPPSHIWTLHMDTQSTTSSDFTRYKTTSRKMYDDARRRVSIPDMQRTAEALMYNDVGEMSEGSLTSIYFFRGGTWVTPPLASGGQEGTTRRWALNKGLCVEGVVKKEDVCEGEEMRVSNGVRGFIRGKVVLGPYQGTGL